MIDILKYLGFVSIGSVTIIGIIGYIAKSIFSTWMQNKIDVYKVKLDKEVEEYKLNLERLAMDHQIRYTKLHNDRAATIKELYIRLNRMEKSMSFFINPFTSASETITKKAKGEIAAKDGNAFFEYYFENKIYFDKSICEIIEQINSAFQDSYNLFIIYGLPSSVDESDSNITNEQRDVWLKSWNKIVKDIPLLKSKLEEQFRILLGVID